MESIPLVRVAESVHVRAGPAVRNRYVHAALPACVRGFGLSGHRRADGVRGSGGAVSLRALLYQEPGMVLRHGLGVQFSVALLCAVSGSGERPWNRAAP